MAAPAPAAPAALLAVACAVPFQNGALGVLNFDGGVELPPGIDGLQQKAVVSAAAVRYRARSAARCRSRSPSCSRCRTRTLGCASAAGRGGVLLEKTPVIVRSAGKHKSCCSALRGGMTDRVFRCLRGLLTSTFSPVASRG
eukprot:7263842-Prymnesium_polylepis.1